MKNLLYVVAVPLVSANAIVNVLFWSSHVDSLMLKCLVAMWSIGLTGVEFVFPAFAAHIHRKAPLKALAAGAVGCVAAFLSIAVFTLAIWQAVAEPLVNLAEQKQATEQAENITNITLRAANITLDAAEGLNELDRYTHGTFPAINKAQGIIQQLPTAATVAGAVGEEANILQYLQLLAFELGVQPETFVIFMAVIVSVLIEVSAMIAVIVINNGIPEIEDGVDAVPAVEVSNSGGRVVPFDQIRADILAGDHGDIPVLSKLPEYYKRFCVRYDDIKKLRDEMVITGELVVFGKNRVRLNNDLFSADNNG